MGSPKCLHGRAAYSEDEVQVTLTHDFEVGQFEVSQSEWMNLGLSNPAGISDSGYGDCIGPDCPVGGVSWFDALEFANRLSSARGFPTCYRLEACSGTLGVDLRCAGVGQSSDSIYDCSGFRLLTEAEWEYAARAGTRTAFYAGPLLPQRDSGDCVHQPHLEPTAWYCWNGGKTTHPRGQRLPNAWGLHDTLGNAFEWVSDEHSGLGYGKDPLIDPGARLGSGKERVRRGGVAQATAPVCTTSKRFSGTWDLPWHGNGFRLARTIVR